jgi:murein DD-endopeptidase MepM/ murein hydrolase activator NlpD
MFSMKGKKYFIYSQDEIKFVEVYKNEVDKYIKNYPLFIIGFVFCLGLVITLSLFLRTPKEKVLLSEKEKLHNAFQLLEQEVDKLENAIQILSTKDDSLYRMILGAEPIPTTVRKAGTGGIPLKKLDIGIEHEAIPTSINERISLLSPKVTVLNYSFDESLELAKKNTERLKHIPAIMPVYNLDLKRTGAGFGIRNHPLLGIRRMHEGLDFYGTKGTEVNSTAAGKVKSRSYSTTFGNVVILDHGYGVETYYAHLSGFNVKKGQKVKRGDVIGYVGNTGLSSGPHLHYEIHLFGKEVDPVHYLFSDLSPEQYQQVIALSRRDVYSMD